MGRADNRMCRQWDVQTIGCADSGTTERAMSGQKGQCDKSKANVTTERATRATGPRAQWAIPFPHLLRERDRK